MPYNIIELGEVHLPFLDGQGTVYGLIDVVDTLGRPAKWEVDHWEPIQGLPRCVRLLANRNGDFACDRGGHKGALFTNGRTIELNLQPILLNDSLQVVGRDAENQPFLWEDGKVTALPARFNPIDMNDHGVIAGDLEYDEETSVAALWHAGNLTEIRVDGLPPFYVDAINNAGQVLVQGFTLGEHDECIASAQGLWSDGEFTPIPVPYDGAYQLGDLNEKGEVLASYWIDVGPPYVYEESAFLWKDGKSADLQALIMWHLEFSMTAGIDDLGQLLVAEGQRYYLLSPQTADSPRGPMKRPDVPARFVFFREPSMTRTVRHLGLPGTTRLAYYFDKLLGRGNAQSAYDPARIRIGERETDPMIVVDDTGITTPTYGYMPWHWLHGVWALDRDGMTGLSICLNRCLEWHNRFPDAKAFMLWLGQELTGGPMVDGNWESMPPKELYPQVEAFVRQYLPKPELPPKTS